MDRRLEHRAVIDTIEILSQRIRERFPEAGLSRACVDLVRVGKDVARSAQVVSRPYLWLRAGIALLLALGVVAQGVLLTTIEFQSLGSAELRFTNLFPAVEATVNLVVIFGVGIFFLWTLEERFKRRTILSGLYKLRAMAHVIDMHQLTKDPTTLLTPGPRTPSSPKRTFSEFELVRYLNYCAEMLALIGKLAALYAQHSQDPLIISAVNDVETLTTNLGRKIWQKITILNQLTDGRSADAKVA